jgi:hypothetical protein
MTRAWTQIAWVTVLGTVACVIASLILNYLLSADILRVR